MMEAGRPGELHKKRLSRFDRRNIFKRHDLRGSNYPSRPSCLLREYNQVEIYFSIVQRKALTPNDFSSLQELEERLLAFQSHYERSASPFNWTFTRVELQG